jgi:putative DNA primase/helicase
MIERVTREQLEAVAAMYEEPQRENRNGYLHSNGNNNANASRQIVRRATYDEVQDALRHVDGSDRQIWLDVGMGLQDEFGDLGKGLWDVWSAQFKGFQGQHDQDYNWSTFEKGGGKTIATLFKYALDAGWKRSVSVVKPADRVINDVVVEVKPVDLGIDTAQLSDDGESESATTGARPEPASPTKYSDIALANRFMVQHGQDFLHVSDAGWYAYEEDRGIWVRDKRMTVFTATTRFLTDQGNQLKQEMLDLAEAKKKPREEAEKAITQAVNLITSKERTYAIVTLLQSRPSMTAEVDQCDRDNWLLNTPGGVVNLRDGSIRPARRNDYFTKCTVVAPREIETPVWDKFLLDIMGAQIPIDACQAACCLGSVGLPEGERKLRHVAETARLAAYLTRLYGYCLTGDTSEHILVVQVGDGGNGKSLLNNLVSIDIMGLASTKGYAHSLPVEALLASKNERHPTELMGLFHARLALACESDEGGRWNEARVKSLSGDDMIKARLMRHDFVEFPPNHKLIVFTNTKPAIRNSDQAAWKRRLHLIPFPQTYMDIPDPSRNILQADQSLRDKLCQEAPGVLHKLIQGCLEYQSDGLQPPETVRDSSEAYLKDQNVVARWFDDRCERVSSFNTKAEDLWRDFVSWAETGKEYVGQRKHFNEKLERLGIRIERTKKGRGMCIGVRLLPSESAPWSATD